MCTVERYRGEHRSDGPFPAKKLALLIIIEMEKHFKDLILPLPHLYLALCILSID